MSRRAPFNLKILKLTPQRLEALRPVTSLDIFDGMSSNFHEDGLFSVATFGRIGSDDRDRRFGFIDIKTEIFHPLVQKRIIQLKSFYEKVMNGREYAKFDPEKNELVACPPDDEGSGTGYGFFCSWWPKIQFQKNKSLSRNLRIDFLEKYRNSAMTDKIVVMPAGLRDVEVDDQGRHRTDEINEPYGRLIAVSNTLSGAQVLDNSAFLDGPRLSLQRSFNQIYDLIDQRLYGKKGFIQAKYGSRAIFNGTRNVITSMDTTTEYFGGPRTMEIYHTQIGLFQTVKGCLPLACHKLATGWLSRVFGAGDANVYLVNPKTLKPEYVRVPADVLDRWTSVEGLEKVIDSFSEVHHRQRPIEIEGYYLGLVYADGKNFKIFNDIDELPEHLDRGNVYPLNMTTLLYLSGYREWYTLPIFVTRFPVTGIQSMYPNLVYTRTTMKASAMIELDADWQPLGDEYVAREFPDQSQDAVFMDSMSPHPAYLVGLGADFDGDTSSGDIVYTKDAREAVTKYLFSRASLVAPNGKLYTSADNDILALVLNNLLSDVEQ